MLKVRASPQKIDFVRQHLPNVQIVPQSDGTYSIGNIEATKLIAFLKENGLVLEQQDALLIIKDIEQAANTVVADIPLPATSKPAPAAIQPPDTDEPKVDAPKAKVFENFDQAFSGFIDGLVNFKINAIETKAVGAETKVTDIETKVATALSEIQNLKDQDIVIQGKFDIAVANFSREVNSLKKKIDDTKKSIEDAQAEINKLNKATLEQHEINIQQILACFEKINISLQANLDEHKKMQENVNKMVQHFRDFPLPK